MNETASENRASHGSVGRRRRALSQLWQVPTFLIGMTAFLLVAASSPYREDLFDSSFREHLRALHDGLKGDMAPADLVVHAEHLLTDVDRHPRRAGEVHFLAGSAYYRHAEAHAGNAETRTKALESLEHAATLDVPEAQQPLLNYRLGVLLYRAGADKARALNLLSESAEQVGAERPAAYRLLVEAHLAQTPPQVEAALAVSRKLLEASADPEAVAQTRLLRGELLIRKQQRIDALKELDRISGNVPRKLRVQARLLQADICADERLWHRAAAVWKELLPDATEVPGGMGRIYYELGHCQASVDPPNHGGAAQAWRDALASGGPEAQAAALRLGELSLFMEARPDEALNHWQTALAAVEQPKDYRNAYVHLHQARSLLDQACTYFFEQQDHGRLETTAMLYKRVSAPGVADQRLAEAAEAQAQRLLQQGSTDAPPEPAKALFRRAGAAYQAAAEAYAADQRGDPYWRSALCYLAGKDFKHAADVLESYVTLEKDEQRLAQAFYSLADAHAAQGQRDLARQAYYKCIEFPSTPYAYRARYQLALEEIEKKNVVHAKEILKQNLTTASPAMDRDAHEKSLYKMAGLLVQMKTYDEAAWYLKEAARQYPNNPFSLYARDLLAYSYLKMAAQAKAKLDELDLARLETLSAERKSALDEMKSYQRRSQRAWQELALDLYQKLAEELTQRARTKPLGVNDSDMQFRALVGIADLRFELNEFSEALLLYQAIQKRYARQPEGLVACQRIWLCVGVITAPPEQARMVRDAAKASVKLAQADLPGLPKDSPGFHGPGVWSWQEWDTWLTWVNGKLNDGATPTVRPNPLAS